MRGMGVTMRRFSIPDDFRAGRGTGPSAALAAKPLPPKITQIQVISTGAMVDGTRGVEALLRGHVRVLRRPGCFGGVRGIRGEHAGRRGRRLPSEGRTKGRAWLDGPTSVPTYTAGRRPCSTGSAIRSVIRRPLRRRSRGWWGDAPPVASLSRGGCPSPARSRPALRRAGLSLCRPLPLMRQSESGRR